MIGVGDTVRIDFPGHVLHGTAARVVAVDPALDLAPDGSDPYRCSSLSLRVASPLLSEPVWLALAHIGGAAEALARRRWDDAGNDKQGELLL